MQRDPSAAAPSPQPTAPGNPPPEGPGDAWRQETWQTPEGRQAPPAGWQTTRPAVDPNQWAVFTHLSGLVALIGIPPFIGPLVLWLIKKDEHPIIDQHGKEALNFQITMTIAWAIAVFLMLVFIGFLLLPVLLVFAVLFPVLGAMAAGKGQPYRYPVSIRFVN